jgi:toxin-antitoxin system PIN domain toxin
MTFLLDANVLIALIDPMHVHYDVAHAWFNATGSQDWATCPLTENAVLRIVGHARYPNSPGTPAAVAPLMAGLRALPGHVFWPDDVSLLETHELDLSRLLNASQVTDSYLLALAHVHDGKLATLDRRMVTAGIPHGMQTRHLIH